LDSSKLTSLFHRGAEADLFLEGSERWKAVVKKRVSKTYRSHELDLQIRRNRTAREAWALHEAKAAGVSVPSLLEVSLRECSITMTYVKGDLARDKLDALGRPQMAESFYEIGRQVGLIHRGGLVHGDLTTSNLILSSNEHPFVLDFGMSSHSLEPEDRGVDLHLLQRSITTSHLPNTKPSLSRIVAGYTEVLGKTEATKSLSKQMEVSRRGRYFALR
jgi:TP53 regulating kinase and related kinases